MSILFFWRILLFFYAKIFLCSIFFCYYVFTKIIKTAILKDSTLSVFTLAKKTQIKSYIIKKARLRSRRFANFFLSAYLCKYVRRFLRSIRGRRLVGAFRTSCRVFLSARVGSNRLAPLTHIFGKDNILQFFVI